MNRRAFETNLWEAAKKLRHNSDPGNWMHKVLGLVFLKYITDEIYSENTSSAEDKNTAATIEKEKQKEQLGYNEYFVPKNAQWNFLKNNAHHSNIGVLTDEAIEALEKLNENLKGIFPENYSDTNAEGLGEFIDAIGNVEADDQTPQPKELLARVFEYLLKKFAESEGKKGDDFYTPQSLEKLLAEMMAPHKGNLYDGCFGTGGMFIQSGKFIKKRGKADTLLYYGQEHNTLIVKIAKMNLAIHGIHANLQQGDAFTGDGHAGLTADYILASPASQSTGWVENFLQDDKRWKYGVPSEKNTDFAWLQHFIYMLSPAGTAGIILKKSSTNSTSIAESSIRKNLIEAKLIDCMVALPSRLFFNAEVNACLWILTKNKTNNRYREADNEILFIDAQKLGVIRNGRRKELTDEDILLISKTYQRWKKINGDYTDIKGFCRAVSIEEVRKKSYTLAPEKYVSKRTIKKILPVLLSIFMFALLYFAGVKNGLFTLKPKIADTAISIKPAILKDTIRLEKKSTKPVKHGATNPPAIVNTIPAEVKNNAEKKPDNVVEVKPPVVEKALPQQPKDETALTRYKVNTTAYFYDKPDINTRRRAYITHWNNSYADIRALDEKNDFIYVVFTNHLHQRSKGWLRKTDLKEIKE